MSKLYVLCVFIVTAFNANSQAGKPDLSFGGKGWVRTPFLIGNHINEAATGILPQPDGSQIVVVAANHTVLTRYKEDGSQDLNYGKNGFSQTAPVLNPKAVMQVDGKIVVAGYSYTASHADFTVARYHQNGHLDSSFDGDGKLTTDVNGMENQAQAILLQPDGKIVVAGATFQMDEEENLLFNGASIVRYNMDGSLDNSFDSDGKLTTNSSVINAIARQADGKIIAAGYAPTKKTGTDFCLLRFNADGSFDFSFGDKGRITTDLINGGDDAAYTMAIDENEALLVAGLARNRGNYNTASFALVRYLSNGVLDNSFDADGKAVTYFGAAAHATNLAIQQDGKIVLGGTSASQVGTNADFALARYNKDGSLDYSFNKDGKLTTNFLNKADVLYGLTLQKNGKVIVAGAAFNDDDNNTDLALAQYYSNGSLDTFFSNDGKQTGFYPFGDLIHNSICVQPDGKVLAASSVGLYLLDGQADFIVTRYTADGTPDSSFGNGLITTDFFGRNDFAASITLQKDGKILVAGTARNPVTNLDEFALARYNANGSLDSTFSKDGKLTTDFPGGSEEAVVMLLQPDGKIMVAGNIFRLGSGYDFALARYHTDGAPDAGFGKNGICTADIAGDLDFVRSAALQADGKIVVAGYAGNPPSGYDIAIARFNKDGSADHSFDGDGKLITDFDNGDDYANAVAVQKDGKIVAAGGIYNSTAKNFEFALVRYNPDGTKDAAFGNNGRARDNFLNTSTTIVAMHLQQNEKIVVAGSAYRLATATDFMVARYKANGTLDSSFGAFGKIISDLSGDDQPAALTIDNNRLLVAGASRDISRDGLIAAYQLEAALLAASFVLVDATNDTNLKALKEGTVINRSEIKGKKINIVVHTDPAKVGSVLLHLNGQQVRKHIENTAPYALFANKETNYKSWKPAVGSYTLKATPYTGKEASGMAGTPLTVSFSVIDQPRLAGFTLVNAATDKDIGPLQNGAVIDLSVTPEINIRADAATAEVGSVLFGINNTSGYHIENNMPFALAANNKNDFHAWPVNPGTYTISATPYTEKNNAGEAGPSVSITIQVIKSVISTPAIALQEKALPNSMEEKILLKAFPNPVSKQGHIEFILPHSTYVSIFLYSVSGNKVMEVFSGGVTGGTAYRKTLPVQALPSGMYYCQLVTQEGKTIISTLIKQ